MSILRIKLEDLQADCVELRYWVKPDITYESQTLSIAQISELVKESQTNYYFLDPKLQQFGQRLFCWLDGEGRWLSRAIDQCGEDVLMLAIAPSQRLAHLPWEILHDRSSFLVQRVNPMVVPMRWIEGKTPPLPDPQQGPLQVFFMATSPENVAPVLDFEQEEARILAATKDNVAVQVRVEESGCVAELATTWKRYKANHFHLFHLTGHADLERQNPYRPYFLTETETGEAHQTFVRELAEVFRTRWPGLIFLSGCRTGQAGQNGAVPSMAESLIGEGARAVLSWGLPVADRTATTAAAHLYRELAQGDTLAQGLASTYRYLLEKEGCRDWHLLRLYVGGHCPGALVEPWENYNWQPPESPQEEFLDPETQEVRVATREEFVGRRRTLQRCLRRLLKSPQFLGVLIYGMGGVGKSTVAARLLERMPGYSLIFIHRGLDEQKLINALYRQCTSQTGLEILQRNLPLLQRLTLFLQGGLNEENQQLVFVLDDFEANLEARADGQQVLKPAVVSVLQDLLQAIANSRRLHRTILTSRYDFPLPEPLNRRLHRESLAALRGADLEKKCDRLPSLQKGSEVEESLQQRAKRAADGNPRLLEWLAHILPETGLQVEDFRIHILAEELLAQQAEDLREMLRLGLLFQVPVPHAAFADMCRPIRNLETHIQRAQSLGLLENIPSPADGTLLRVPRLLPLPLPENNPPLHREAAEILYRHWWEDSEKRTEERLKEIHRLALCGNAGEIAANMGNVLGTLWNKTSQFREALKICQDTLAVIADYRIFRNLARSEQQLGEVEKAAAHYQQALDHCPPDDERGKAAIVHDLATLKTQLGENEAAIALHTESLELYERIGNL
ncbi:CHAT domain-containing protein, partial [Phormidium sp. CCY1219]|uniref:CHAT domain-containing protein n=1 Tax=Phormidium sp. CCY1219 TaxID=2886104 RepID=UPI002D1E601B